MVATRRDLDDPVTVKQVAALVPSRALLELLHALAISDGLATGPAAWNDWKATLVADLVRRVAAVLAGEPMPEPAPLRKDQLALAADGGPAATVRGSEVTVVAPDRPGLLWRAAGVLASHRLAVRSANARLRIRGKAVSPCPTSWSPSFEQAARPDPGARRTCTRMLLRGWTWRTGWNTRRGPSRRAAPWSP